MSIKAKPTRYCGTLFRSRSEARLAVCLDAYGWGWEYEPEELMVEGWSPDFLVNRPNGPSLVVEYKPADIAEEYKRFLCKKFSVLSTQYQGRMQRLEHPVFCLCVHDFFNANKNVFHGMIGFQRFEYWDQEFEDFLFPVVSESPGKEYRFDLLQNCD